MLAFSRSTFRVSNVPLALPNALSLSQHEPHRGPEIPDTFELTILVERLAEDAHEQHAREPSRRTGATQASRLGVRSSHTHACSSNAREPPNALFLINSNAREAASNGRSPQISPRTRGARVEAVVEGARPRQGCGEGKRFKTREYPQVAWSLLPRQGCSARHQSPSGTETLHRRDDR